MMNGNIDMEIHRFKNLSNDELKMLYGEYQIRLKQISTELKKRTKPSEVYDLSIDIMHRHSHCDEVFETDAEYIAKKFESDSDWNTTHSKYPDELLALCIVNDIYSIYNIEFNPYDYLEEYGLDGTQFQLLYSKLKDWTKKNYWRK